MKFEKSLFSTIHRRSNKYKLVTTIYLGEKSELEIQNHLEMQNPQGLSRGRGQSQRFLAGFSSFPPWYWFRSLFHFAYRISLNRLSFDLYTIQAPSVYCCCCYKTVMTGFSPWNKQHSDCVVKIRLTNTIDIPVCPMQVYTLINCLLFNRFTWNCTYFLVKINWTAVFNFNRTIAQSF